MSFKGNSTISINSQISINMFYDNISFAIWNLDSQKIQISNKLGATLFSMPMQANNLLSLDIETFINYASIDFSKDALIRILTNESSLEGFLNFTTPKNQNLHFRYKTEIVKSEENLHTQTVIFLEEFTLQKKLEEDFRKYSDWQEAILNASPYSIITTDEKGIIKSFNRAAEMMLGYTSEEVIGKYTPELFHDKDETFKKSQEISLKKSIPFKPDFFTFVESAIFNGRSIDEWTYIRKDGFRFPVKLCVTPIYSKKHEITGFMGIAEDLSHQKLLEKTVMQQTEQIVDQMKFLALGKMASGVAHEINNPLSIINGNVDILNSWVDKNVNENEQKQNFKNRLKKTKQSIEQISNIIKSMKLFSQEYSPAEIKPIKLIEIINQVLNLNSEKLISHKIKLTLEVDKDLEIVCHYSTMGHVILNLLNNAIEAIETADEKWIFLKAVKIGNRFVELRIVDSGHGIPKEIRKRIMEPFFSGKDMANYSGLGLSTSKSIVEGHGGKLFLDEAASHTTFVMSLSMV